MVSTLNLPSGSLKKLLLYVSGHDIKITNVQLLYNVTRNVCNNLFSIPKISYTFFYHYDIFGEEIKRNKNDHYNINIVLKKLNYIKSRQAMHFTSLSEFGND